MINLVTKVNYKLGINKIELNAFDLKHSELQ